MAETPNTCLARRPGLDTVSNLFKFISSVQNLQAIKANKVLVALYWSPARIGMMIEDRKLDLLYGPFTGWRRTGVINDPVAGTPRTQVLFTQKDHHVIRKLLHPGLIEEQ